MWNGIGRKEFINASKDLLISSKLPQKEKMIYKSLAKWEISRCF